MDVVQQYLISRHSHKLSVLGSRLQIRHSRSRSIRALCPHVRDIAQAIAKVNPQSKRQSKARSYQDRSSGCPSRCSIANIAKVNLFQISTIFRCSRSMHASSIILRAQLCTWDHMCCIMKQWSSTKCLSAIFWLTSSGHLSD